MQKTKALLSIGAAIASAQVARAMSTLDFDDVLRPFGLARRRGDWPAKLAFLGAGIVLGGVGALLFAPASGASTRARIAGKAEELREAASTKARALGDELSDRVNALHPGFGANQAPSGA